MVIRGVANLFFDTFFPSRCLSCGESSSGLLCKSCEEGLEEIEQYCTRCGRPSPWGIVPICGWCVDKNLFLESTISLYYYISPLKEVIHAWKYRRSVRAWSLLKDLLHQGLKKREASLKRIHPELVVPVPLHWRRKWIREFNQSALLSEEVATFLSIPSYPAIARVRHTKPQFSLPPAKRKTNIKDAFVLKGEVRGKVIFLIDDIATTLSTASEIARILRKGGAREIHLLTLARAVENI